MVRCFVHVVAGDCDAAEGGSNRIVDMADPLAKFAATIDWGFLEQRFGAVGPGRPRLPTRLWLASRS